jgi:hypothetical protein
MLDKRLETAVDSSVEEGQGQGWAAWASQGSSRG